MGNIKYQIEKIKELEEDGILCGCCGKKPEIKKRIEYSNADPLNILGLQKEGYYVDFHYHHLIYGNGVFNDFGIWLCNKCHMRQKNNNTPVNRVLQLQAITKMEYVKDFCKDLLPFLKNSSIGKSNNTIRTWCFS